MNQPPKPRRRPPQISLSFMMMMMVIFAFMSAGLLYAAKVPALQEEWSLLVGGKPGSSSGDQGRLPHIVFIMFTFTSPLLLAGVLSTGLALVRWLDRAQTRP